MHRSVAGVVICLLAGSGALPAVAAATPSPSPSGSDSATTVEVSPLALADRQTLTLRGYSDCAILDGHLIFTRYDGSADNVVVRSAQSTRYDAVREKYPFSVQIPVPAQAQPGVAKVYAEPFCGPPEEYPPSRTVPVRIVPSALSLTTQPSRPRAGDLLRLRAALCDGSPGPFTFAFTLAGSTQRVPSTVGADGVVRATLRLGPGEGLGTLTVPDATRQCPGSLLTGPLSVPILPPVKPGSPPTAVLSAARASPVPTTSPVLRPSPASSAIPSSRVMAPRGSRSGTSRLAISALVLATVVGSAVLLLRRRARG